MRDKQFPLDDSASAEQAVRRLSMSILRQRQEFEKDVVTRRLNNGTMVLVFLITVTNMFITGFGIETINDETEANVTTS